MTIKIQSGRQFITSTPDAPEAAPVFDNKGNLGGWLPAASEKLVSLNVALKLKNGPTLKTADEWKTFIAENASNKDAAAQFPKKFGITFQDFAEIVDDLAASGEGNIELDLSPSSSLGRALSLDSVDGNYSTRFKNGGPVSLTADVKGEVVIPGINKSIFDTIVPGETWQRDRTEQESWADFKTADGATKIFKDNTGVAAFEKLYQPKWDDPAAQELADRFFLPLHPEVTTTAPANPDGSPTFQDKNEMFREVYYDDRQGSLAKADASVRARVRFDDDEPYTVRRVLIQAKEGREIDASGRSAVHKFEKRWENESVTEAQAQQMLVSGRDKDGKIPLLLAQQLYRLTEERGTLPSDGSLKLEPKHLVLQKRRRTHLHLDSLSEVTKRRDELKTQVDALVAEKKTPDAQMTKFLEKLDAQVAFLTDGNALMKKYGSSMPSGEAFIVSADRYSVYDPAARATPPNDLDDEVGLVGKGLHVEAEWDSASSDRFETALEKIDEQLKGSPANRAELEADRAAIEKIRETFRSDVAATVELMKENLEKAGLELDPSKKSKDERAGEFMKAAAEDRAVYWF